MTTSERSAPTNAELLALIERQQRELQQQKFAMQTALYQQRVALQKEFAALRTGTGRGSHNDRSVLHRLQAAFRVPFGRHTRRMGVGLALATILTTAPWGSGASHAAGTLTFYGDGALATGGGSYNSAFGNNALSVDTSGSRNVAAGSYALFSNTTGDHNTASGADALKLNDTGHDNTASGFAALNTNAGGFQNTAIGADALYYNTNGAFNTASGFYALYSNTTGNYNAAAGDGALYLNTGSENSAFGTSALSSNTTGSHNTAVGQLAGWTAAGLTNTTGSYNTFIGYHSGPGTSSELTNATSIGANAVVSQSNSIVLGGTGANTQKVGVGTETPHSAFQIAKGFLQIRPITGSEPAAAQCVTDDDAGRLVVRTDGNINLYVCTGTTWIGK